VVRDTVTRPSRTGAAPDLPTTPTGAPPLDGIIAPAARRRSRTRRRRRTRVIGVLAAALGLALVIGVTGRQFGWFAGGGTPRRVLVSNEFAHFNPHDRRAVRSAVWDVTSGSLFRWGDAFGAGPPDDRSPDARSRNGTGSAVFRAVRDGAMTDGTVTFSLRNDGLVSTPRTPAVAFDGVHVFLRYQSQEELYVVSVNRRDDSVAIKKKLPGGDANGGHYSTLAQAYAAVRYHEWVPYEVSIVTTDDGAVHIELASGTRVLLRAVDHGQAGAPILAAGRVGLRGDNCRFTLERFAVHRTH